MPTGAPRSDEPCRAARREGGDCKSPSSPDATTNLRQGRRSARPSMEGVMPPNPGSIPPDRQRAFEAARRAAMALCPGHCGRRTRFHAIAAGAEDPLVVERVRWLLVAMGVARGTPGGRAIAEIARLGYVMISTSILPARGWRPIRLDHPGIIHAGEPLPGPYRSWATTEIEALKINAAELPRLQFVTAHSTMRIL